MTRTNLQKKVSLDLAWQGLAGCTAIGERTRRIDPVHGHADVCFRRTGSRNVGTKTAATVRIGVIGVRSHIQIDRWQKRQGRKYKKKGRWTWPGDLLQGRGRGRGNLVGTVAERANSSGRVLGQADRGIQRCSCRRGLVRLAGDRTPLEAVLDQLTEE